MSVRIIPCDHCGRKFAEDNALRQHIRHRHPRVKGIKQGKKSMARQAERNMDARMAYELVDALDLPDGAHWAMLEEMTGMEPADFAFLGDD